MSATVSIIEIATGNARIYEDKYCLDKEDYGSWSDGNYSCDCNRGHIFGDKNADCGCGKYMVSVFVGGRFVYVETPKDFE